MSAIGLKPIFSIHLRTYLGFTTLAVFNLIFLVVYTPSNDLEV